MDLVLACLELPVIAFLLWLLSVRHHVAVLSPTYAFCAFFLMLCAGGSFVYFYGSAYHVGFYAIGISDRQLLRAASLLLLEVISFLIGANLVAWAPRRYRLYAPRVGILLPRAAQSGRTSPSSRLSTWLTAASLLLPGMLLGFGVGFEHLLSRNGYLIYEYQPLKALGAALSLAVVPLCGYLAFSRPGMRRALVFALILAAYEIIFIGLSSRRMVVTPALFFIGAILATPHSKVARIGLVASAVAIPWLNQVALDLRILPTQGIWPAVTAIVDVTKSARSYVDLAKALNSFVPNIFFGLPVAAYVLAHTSALSGSMLLSLNPAPGALIGWYLFEPRLRVNQYVPFNAIGEAMGHGPLFLILYFTVVGAIFVAQERFIRREVARGTFVLPLVILGLLLLFVFFSTQYQLRAATRFLYYSIALQLLVTVLRAVKHELRRQIR